MTLPISFEDGVKLRLKSIIAELMPEDKLESLVQSTTLDFINKDLPELIKAELRAKYQEIIREELSKGVWQGHWDYGEEQASEMVKTILIEAAPDILASMMGSMSQKVVSSLRSAIQQGVYY